MTALQHVRLGAYHVVPMASPDDFDEWRDHARRMVMADVPPDRVAWTEPGGPAGNPSGTPGGAQSSHTNKIELMSTSPR